MTLLGSISAATPFVTSTNCYLALFFERDNTKKSKYCIGQLQEFSNFGKTLIASRKFNKDNNGHFIALRAIG